MVATGAALTNPALMPNAVSTASTTTKDESQPVDTTEGGYRAKRYALKYQPPCIFLEYEDTTKKRRVRAVKLNGISPTVDVDRLTRKVIRSFPRKLEASSVKYDQVRKLVVKLLDHLAASESAAASSSETGAGRQTRANGTGSTPGRPSAVGAADGPPAGGPLPTVSPRTDQRSPGARLAQLVTGLGRGIAGNYRASVESNMSRFSTSTGGSDDDGDDELTSALDELNRELGGAGDGVSNSGLSTRANQSSNPSELASRDSSFSYRDRPAAPVPGPASSSAPAASAAAAGSKSRFAAEAEKLVIGLELTDDTDLNKVTEVELRMAKLAMEEDFRKNQLRPGDPGYEYDKQEDFGPPTEANDWDDSSEEEAEPSEEPEVNWADIHAAVVKPAGAKDGPATGKDSASPYNSNDWPGHGHGER